MASDVTVTGTSKTFENYPISPLQQMERSKSRACYCTECDRAATFSDLFFTEMCKWDNERFQEKQLKFKKINPLVKSERDLIAFESEIEKLQKDQRYCLTIDEKAMTFLREKSNEAELEGYSIKRVIESYLTDPLAEKFLLEPRKMHRYTVTKEEQKEGSKDSLIFYNSKKFILNTQV